MCAVGAGTSPGNARVSKGEKGARLAGSAMLYQYSIDTVVKLVSVRFTVKLSYAIIRDYASKLLADNRFSPGFAELVDLRDVRSLVLSPHELMDLAGKVDPFARISKRAFVVQGKAQIHAAQLHRILRKESKTIRVFQSMEEARDWIEGKPVTAARATPAGRSI
ncbi:MAG: hypothetical protein WBS24_07925 [Terriglobales bacterium]